MATNTTPIFTTLPKIYGAKNIAASAAYTGNMDTTNLWQVWAAGGNGSYVQKIRFKALASTAATVARVWINNGASISTQSNNCLYDEITIPATVGGVSTAGSATYELALNIGLKPLHKIYVTLGTSPGANGFDVLAFGGDY